MPIKELQVDIVPQIRRMEIFARRRVLSQTIEGSWVTRFKGRGIEFAGYRSYEYGDDASLIDWRASLRSKSTLVKEFEVYKNFNVFFLLDVSNSMLFSSTDKLKCEFAAELLYSMATAILKAGDSVGMAMFNDHIFARIPPNIGVSVQYRLVSELTNPENYGGKIDFNKVIRQTMSFLSMKSVVIIMSDFLGMPEKWGRYINMMSTNYDVIGIMIRDPRDRSLPKNVGQYMLKDPYSNKNIYIDVNQFSEKYEEFVKKEEEYIKNVFTKAKGGFVVLQTDQDYVEPLLKFFKRREHISMQE
jgi:uncharacterized protein (DUF58 family)